MAVVTLIPPLRFAKLLGTSAARSHLEEKAGMTIVEFRDIRLSASGPGVQRLYVPLPDLYGFPDAGFRCGASPEPIIAGGRIAFNEVSRELPPAVADACSEDYARLHTFRTFVRDRPDHGKAFASPAACSYTGYR